MPAAAMNPDTPRAGRPWRVWGLRGLKVAVAAAVIAFVGQTLYGAAAELIRRGVSIDPVSALGAGLVLAAAQLPMAWFWRRSLVALEQPAPWFAAWSAFGVSQMGKYAPGKGMVVVIRTERLLAACRRADHRPDTPPSTAAIGATVFYETLTHMAVGSLLAAALATVAPLGDASRRGTLVGLALALAGICLTPTLPPVFAWLLARVTRGRLGEGLAGRLGYGLAARGAAASALSWSLAGVGVWLAARSVGAGESLTPAAWTGLLLAATLPVIAGFVSLLPGGVIVREGLTLTVLAPLLGETDALATTVALRLIWVAAEGLLCGSLLAIGSIGGSRQRAKERTLP